MIVISIQYYTVVVCIIITIIMSGDLIINRIMYKMIISN